MTRDEFTGLYPFFIQSKVEWGDMDAFQHVNNTVFFRYFERVRIAFVRHAGMASSTHGDGFGVILASTQCRFRVPLTFPDEILIGTSVTDLEADRFRMKYGVYSVGREVLAAEGDGVIVGYDYRQNRKAPFPEDLRARLEAEIRE
jgi:acyl-CoA thioester hydrolase